MTRLDDPAVKVVVEVRCRWWDGHAKTLQLSCPYCDGTGVEYLAVFEPLPGILNVNATWLDVPA